MQKKKFAPIKKMKNGGVFGSISDGLSQANGQISDVFNSVKKPVNDTLKGTFDTSLKDIGNLGNDYLHSNLDTFASPLSYITGRNLSDMTGYKYKSDFGKSADELSDAKAGFFKRIGPLVGGIAAQSVGIPTSVGSGAVYGAQALYDANKKEDEINGVKTFGKGGGVDKALINVEKGELEVDPKTLEIVKDFKNKPPHPKDGKLINVEGNTLAQKGNVIVPQNMREKFLNGSALEKTKMLNDLSKRSSGMKKAIGGDVAPYENGAPGYYNFEGDNSSYNPNGVPTIADFGTGTGGYQYAPAYANAPTQQVLPATPGAYTSPAASNPNQFGNLAGTASQFGTLGLGLYQNYQANKGLKELGKTPVPNFTITPEMDKYYNSAYGNATKNYLDAKNRAGYGYNTAQRAQFNQTLAQQNNTAFRNAVNSGGGNLTKAINAAIGASNIGAQNQFAVNDAMLQNQKELQAANALNNQSQTGIGLSNAYTNQRNLATQQEIQRRMEKERALGLAKAQGNTNIASAFNAIGALNAGGNSGVGSLLGAI